MTTTPVNEKTRQYAEQLRRADRLWPPSFRAVRQSASAVAVSSAILFSFVISGFTLALALGTLVASILLDGAGFIWSIVRRFRASGQDKDDPLARRRSFFRPTVGGVLLTMLGVVMAVCLVRNVGASRIDSGAMAPLIERGQWIVFSKRITNEDLQPGKLIIFELAAGSPVGAEGSYILGHIIAGPGDAIARDGLRYRINGRPSGKVGPTGHHDPVVRVPRTPQSLTIPEDRYFVRQTAGKQGIDSRLLGYAQRSKVLGGRLMYASGAKWGEPIN